MRDETERPQGDFPGGTSDYGDKPTETPPQGGDEDETVESGGDKEPGGWDEVGPGDTDQSPGDGGLPGY